MDCDIAREALSARIDGEREPIPAARVDEHLAGCPPCRDWQAVAVEQTQSLRRLAGRSQVAVVRTPAPAPPRPTSTRPSWRRWALGAVGGVQIGLAVAQGLVAYLGGAHLGIPHAAGHVLNESTAWSAALGVAMVAAAIRPVLAGGLAWVLGIFAIVLVAYEVADISAGAVGPDRLLTHLPVIAGAALALLVWRRDRPHTGPEPDSTAADAAELLLPDNASRGRRRSHLRPSDGSAA